MTYEQVNIKKYQELVSIAVGHTTDSQKTSYKCLFDAFWSYFKWHEEGVEAGYLTSYGSMSGGSHNAQVLALIIARSVNDALHLDDLRYFEVADILNDVAFHKSGEPLIYEPFKKKAPKERAKK